MIERVPAALNRQNLLLMADNLKEFRYFIFFGTLLGICRGGDVIEGDDDIDFLVEISERDALIEKLKKLKFLVDLNSKRNASKYFLQATKEVEGVQTYVDFYFYENSVDNDYILEKWNFTGNYIYKYNFMHVPKKIIFPLETIDYLGKELSVPNSMSACCQYLYGESWRTPLSKKMHYKIFIFKNKPKIVFGLRGKIIFEAIKFIRRFYKLGRFFGKIND